LSPEQPGQYLNLKGFEYCPFFVETLDHLQNPPLSPLWLKGGCPEDWGVQRGKKNMNNIKKINKNENIELRDYDAILMLSSGKYLYNMNQTDKEEIKKFIKEENLFSEEKIKAVTFINKTSPSITLSKGEGV
jgi:hypothetical protein